MNTFQKVLIGATVILVPFLGSCKKDPVSCNYITEVQTESDALIAAANLYYADVTITANCNAYKAAYNNYLNALEGVKDCATTNGQGPAIQQVIDESRAALDLLQC
ncbi:MAG: hypothetical protein WBP41_17655 [Saprospiraceae bacterium]